MALPLPVELALLSMPVQGKTEQKLLLGSGGWHRALLEMTSLESTWVSDSCEPGAEELGGRLGL